MRSIPACAGNPDLRIDPSYRPAVHPRVCGEPVRHLRRYLPLPGPSPRVRGTPSRPRASRPCPRSIPACAGNPRPASDAIKRPGVHPRVCGEPHFRLPLSGRRSGPSPRVRGTPGRASARPGRRRSIPACAGNPSRHARQSVFPAVHPRVCGEPSAEQPEDCHAPGPSPRVRGTRIQLRQQPIGEGSIPACAGNPWHPPCPRPRRRVHPRVCGEPRAGLVRDAPGSRSIPACAGNPWRPRAHRPRRPGPSPRVRGTLVTAASGKTFDRSIPACAGNPSRRRPCARRSRVHPRVCGEPRTARSSTSPSPGPSPRVRGTPGRRALRRRAPRSIPACAGNPSSPAGPTTTSAVHPRVCGEPLFGSTDGLSAAGPSPRVRGTRYVVDTGTMVRGSIPACAGNPRCPG